MIHIDSFEHGFEYFAVAICHVEGQSWYAAGHTREQAIQHARAGLAQHPKPAYFIVAKYDVEKVKRDLALLHTPVQGRA